jgi:hypothetical protein
MTELPAVAKKVFYPCKKCAVDRYQVVLAHTSSKLAKLECEVCKTKNSLKLDTPATATRAAVPRKTGGVTRAAAHVARWSELRDKTAGSPSPYNMKGKFEVGNAIEHPKFGVGFVVVVSGQAMQVVFQDEERSLVHSRG